MIQRNYGLQRKRTNRSCGAGPQSVQRLRNQFSSTRTKGRYGAFRGTMFSLGGGILTEPFFNCTNEGTGWNYRQKWLYFIKQNKTHNPQNKVIQLKASRVEKMKVFAIKIIECITIIFFSQSQMVHRRALYCPPF